MRLLIVNADDFGLNDATTDGIVDSHVAGSVTSTTLMVNAPGTERASALARGHPALGVGLHFNLTWGRPVSDPLQVPSLLDASGAFVSRNRLARRILLGRVPSSQIAIELESQMIRLRDLGVDPSHIDSHQHVHGFGPVFDAVASHCMQHRIPVRVPWVARDSGGGVARSARRAVLALLLSRSTHRWQGKVSWNDGIGSIFDLPVPGRQVNDSAYRELLQRAQGETFELMVHPATSASAMAGYTRIGEIAECEWQYLREGSLAKVAEAAGFTLGTYRDLRP